MSKTLEKIVFSRLYEHYSSISDSSHFYFRKKWPSLLHFVSFLNKNYASVENGDEFGQNSQISAKPLIESIMELFSLNCIAQILEGKKFSLTKSYL